MASKKVQVRFKGVTSLYDADGWSVDENGYLDILKGVSAELPNGVVLTDTVLVATIAPGWIGVEMIEEDENGNG